MPNFDCVSKVVPDAMHAIAVCMKHILYLSTGKHRTKSHVSVFLKRNGNMQFHVSVIFTSRGNVKTQVLRDSVTFPERKLPSHVSAMFKPADFRYCAFPSCFCKRIYSCLLHLPKHKPSRSFLELIPTSAPKVHLIQ